MQMGRPYLVTFSLVDAGSNATVASYPAYRVSRAPGAARQSMNISFDAKNRVLVRGKPRFVLGVYDSGSGYSAQDAFWENQLWSPTGERRLNGMNINFYLNYWYGEAPADARLGQSVGCTRVTLPFKSFARSISWLDSRSSSTQ